MTEFEQNEAHISTYVDTNFDDAHALVVIVEMFIFAAFTLLMLAIG